MKGFLQEYGIIMVVVAVVLGMLAFGKSGYAKSIQGAILGSVDHIVETGDNITKSDKKEVNVKTGDLLTIEGQNYIVLKENGDKALVMTVDSVEERAYHGENRADGLSISTYEGSKIDNYLEGTWYKKLSAKTQSAIQATSIKQVSYGYYLSDKSETGYAGQIYNTITRHVFLPSVSELQNVVNLNDMGKVRELLGERRISFWTRDSHNSQQGKYGEIIYFGTGGLHDASISDYSTYGVRPTFTIDLSQVDYTEAGHVMYK